MKKPKTVLYRRRREQRTGYKKRLSLLLSGKPRVVLRFTNRKIIAQAVEFREKGDKVLAAVDSLALKKAGWNHSCKNLPAAYLTGLLLGKRALEKGLKEAILDTGMVAPLKKSRVYAFLKGVLDAGLSVPHRPEGIFPDEARVTGAHIAEYLKSRGKAEDVPKQFKEVKSRLTEVQRS